MLTTSKASVLFHMRKEDIEKQMNDTDNKRSYEHLLAIKLAYDGKTPKEIASILSRSLPTVYNWLNVWNENGLQGIIPNFGGGDLHILIRKNWMNCIKSLPNKNPAI
jgi:putative transposase